MKKKLIQFFSCVLLTRIPVATACLLMSFAALGPAYAQDQADSPSLPVNLPLIGSVSISQKTVETAGAVVGGIVTLGCAVFPFFLIWSAMGSFKRVPRDKGLSFGWNSVKGAPFFFVKMTLLFLLIAYFYFIIEQIIFFSNRQFYWSLRATEWYGYASFLLNFICYSYALAGALSIVVQYVDRGTASLKLFLVNPLKYLNFLAANILYTLGLVISSIVLIVPAAWFGSRYFFWPYVLLSKNVSFVQAFQESARMSRSAKMEIFLFWYLMTALTLLGILIVGVGYLIAFPVTMLATAFVYKNMTTPPQPLSVGGK